MVDAIRQKEDFIYLYIGCVVTVFFATTIIIPMYNLNLVEGEGNRDNHGLQRYPTIVGRIHDIEGAYMVNGVVLRVR